MNCTNKLIYLLLAVAASVSLAFSQDLVLSGGKVYSSPGAAPLEHVNVVVRGGKIVSVGAGKVRVEKGTEVIDCTGKVIVAGFWNSHVHFQTGWQGADTMPADKVEAHMQEMLTRWGFTTVWDLGSDPQNTLALRKRVESGEVRGPKILTAGTIFPENGHPVYLPAELILPEAATPADAIRMVRGYMSMGLDGTKLFTGSYMGRDKPVVNMDVEIVKAAVSITHEMQRPVFTHPQNHAGVDSALAAGVDVLAHTIPTEGSFTPDELARIKQLHTKMTPTLTLWTTVTPNVDAQKYLVQAGVDELKAFAAAGGVVLFGTDVGFTTKYDTSEEYEYMGRAISWSDILASLTTNPAEFFKQPTKGRVEKDMDADLVVLDGDPAADVRNFAKVAWTVRAGRVIWSGAEKK
jgi:imidazolonepropionase-like amidohydrolase